MGNAALTARGAAIEADLAARAASAAAEVAARAATSATVAAERATIASDAATLAVSIALVSAANAPLPEIDHTQGSSGSESLPTVGPPSSTASENESDGSERFQRFFGRGRAAGR